MLIACCSVSYQTKKGKNNVELTDFTKDLISLYINDALNIDAKNRKDAIIVTAVADTSYYYLSVFANNCKEYKFCREDFIGQTVYLGHLVRIFGDESSMFYSVNEKIKKQERCKDNYTIYDPNVWQICFYKNKSFNKMRTYKTTLSKDISTIQSLAEKFFGASNVPVANNEIYQIAEVEIAPEFTLGEDSLRHIINSNFAVKRNNVQGKVPVVVNILIDKNGKATLNNISKSSNDTEIDNEALRVAKIICQYEFVPASHRGEKVNALFPVVFLRNDIVP